MKAPQLSTRFLTASLILQLVSAALLLGCCGNSAGPAPKPLAAKSGTEPASPEPSDLDEPVETLMAAVCEHKIPTYTCDECRYEVGVVKVPEELFDAAKGGTLQTLKVAPRVLSSGKDLNGEIRLNEERAVYLSPVAPGIVRSIRIDLGGRSARGQVLYEVDSPTGFKSPDSVARPF